MLLLCVSFAGIPLCLEPDDFGQQCPKGSKVHLTCVVTTMGRTWSLMPGDYDSRHRICRASSLLSHPCPLIYFSGFGQIQSSLRGTWEFRPVWEWEGQKAATILHPPSRPWRPWRASSTFCIVHGTLRMKRIYPVSKSPCSYRKFWGGFFVFWWFFSLNVLL